LLLEAAVASRAFDPERVKDMPRIRINRTPAGEAPEHIRRAWVGLVLPLANDKGGPRQKHRAFGVLSGPRGFLATVWRMLRGSVQVVEGYSVVTTAAVAILEASNPGAAVWWRENTPYLMRRNSRLIFDVEACEEIPENTVSAPFGRTVALIQPGNLPGPSALPFPNRPGFDGSHPGAPRRQAQTVACLDRRNGLE
jgi:hypothetical protein